MRRDGNCEGESMSSEISIKYVMARGTGVIVSILQHGLMVAGVVFVVGLAGLFAGNTAFIATLESWIPGFDAKDESVAGMAVAAAAEPEQGTVLSPKLRAVLDDVAHRYRVSAAALVPVFAAAQATAREQHLDPLLIIAVIAIESRFNPFSESPMGAQGLMQVIPRFHQDKLPEDAGKMAFLDPITNVQVGAQALRESIRRNGDLLDGLQQFGGAADDEQQGYANKVLAEKERLEQVARRVRAVRT
jgi:hypothetical protein